MVVSNLKLSLRKDAIRVLSSSEMQLVIGGLALSPAKAMGTNTLQCTIHCTSNCAIVKYAGPVVMGGLR
jgi:hypothetical protein